MSFLELVQLERPCFRFAESGRATASRWGSAGCSGVRPLAYSRLVQPSEQDSAQAAWVAPLCLECGLCCNGVLFSDVKLAAGEDASVLENKGLTIRKLGSSDGFDQPCACFDGRACEAYQHRPSRCREFHCHTLKQASTGAISADTALRRIREARAEAARVRELLRALGQEDEHLPLTKRYQAVKNEPIDLSLGEETADHRGELMLAVNDLMTRLHRDFLE